MACFAYGNIAIPGMQDLRVNATYFIDSEFGNDSTAVFRDMSRPFRTIGAVLALMQPGEVVYVQPGTYSAPSLSLGGTIWYFSQGSTITTNVNGSGFVYGYGTFIGQSPAITCGSGAMVFYGQSVSTPTGPAILVNGPLESVINVQNMPSTEGISVVGNVFCEINVDKFLGEGTFMTATGSSSGQIQGKSQHIECGIFIRSSSGSLKVNFEAQYVRTYTSYGIDIDDQSGGSINSAIYNVHIAKVDCLGLLSSSGIASVTDVLQQPNVNLNIQNINIQTTLSVPAILCSSSFVNVSYDSFAFAYVNPIQFIVVVGDVCILHMNGARTYNADQTFNSDVGFAQITSGNYSAIRCNFIELFLTGQLIQCDGNSEAQFDVTNFTNICPLPRSCIVNNAQCVLNIQKMLTFYPDNNQIVVNNGMMQFNVGAWQAGSSYCQMIVNTSRFQTRIGFLVTDGSNNTIIGTTGSIAGLVIGSIRMDGNGNTGIAIAGPALVEIGQILSTNSGNIGVRVEDPGQLYGRIARIIMVDQSCIEFHSSLESNITFDWMTNRANSYIVYVAGIGEVTMSGNSMTANEVKYPVYVVTEKSKFNLKLVRMDIVSCGAGIWIEAHDSDVNINIQHFVISTDAGTAGIYANRGRLTLEGNYYMQTGSASPLILLDGESSLKARLGFVSTSYAILNTRTTGDVWYEASESITREIENNIFADLPSSGQLFTVKGLFKTPGDYNLLVSSAAVPAIRAINAVMISASRNIVSPAINVISNYSIGNNGLAGGTAVPAGGFVVDPGVV